MIFQGIGSVGELLGFLRSDRSGAALLRGGVGSLLLKLLQAVLALLVAVLLARLLGPAQYGIYAFVFALVTVLIIPVQMGLPVLVVRETAAGQAREDWGVVYDIWHWALRVICIGSGTVITMAGIFMLVSWEGLAPGMRWTSLWAMMLIPVLALNALHGAALRGRDHVVLGQLPDYVLRLALLAVMLPIWWAWSRYLGAPDAMLLHLAAAALALGISHLLLRRFAPVNRPRLIVHTGRSRAWLASMMPLGFIAAAQVINTRADTLLLGMLTDPASVGIYQVAVQGAQAVALGLGAINLLIAPRFASLYSQGEQQELQRLVTISARAILLLTLPVVLLLVVVGNFAIKAVFGAEYQTAYLPLVILALGQLANAGFGSVAMLLNMTGHERATARGLIWAATLNIVLNALLIPAFDIIGASVATALSLTAWNFLLWNATRRLLGINTLAVRSIKASKGSIS